MNKMIKIHAILLSAFIPAAFAAGTPSLNNAQFTSLQGPDVQLYSTLDGVVVAENVTPLTAPATGKILDLDVKVGDTVAKDARIANVFTPAVQKTLLRLERRGKKTAREDIAKNYDLPTVYSPYAGFVSELTVNANDKVRIGQKIGSVATKSIVRAHNADKMFVTPQNGMQVVFYDAKSQVSMHGYVDSFTYTNKEGFYNFDIALVTEPGSGLVPGAKVTGKILSYESHNSSKIKNDAIIRKDGKAYVLTANEVIINASDSEYSEVLQIEAGYEYVIPSSLIAAPKKEAAPEVKPAPKKRVVKRAKPKKRVTAQAPAPQPEPQPQQTIEEQNAALSTFDDALSLPGDDVIEPSK